MRQIKTLFICVLMLFLVSISTAFATENKQNKASKIVVEVTTFPIYDFMRHILGANNESIELRLIIDNGIDLHNFQPSTKDIARISTADVFIYNGGDSDSWVEKILSQALNKDMKVINLMESLGDKVKVELVVEGMQAHDHAGHDHAGHENCDHDHGTHAHENVVYDEHVWLSLKNAILMCQTLSTQMQALDPAHAELYAKNTQAYVEKLQNLDAKYTEIFQNIPNKTVLFADRFPFRYLLDDYGIGYYAAFPGCSAETEASFETVIFLAKKINELNLQSILIIDDSTNNIAKPIIENSKNKEARTFSLHSLQTVNAKDMAQGITYLTVMEQNLQKLKDALE